MARTAVAVIAVFLVHVLPIYFKRSRSDDVSAIMGLVDPSAGDEDTYLQGEAAWNALKGMISMFVGKGDTTSKLEDNDLVGKYSIFFDEENYDAAAHGEKYLSVDCHPLTVGVLNLVSFSRSDILAAIY